MSAIRSRDNKSEVALRKALFRRGLRYRLHLGALAGRPDIVFKSAKVVIFVDGDYWHGRRLREGGLKAVREYYTSEQQAYWVGKLLRTVERDDRASHQLRELGWHVIRIWESELRQDIEGTADLLARVVRHRLRAANRDG